LHSKRFPIVKANVRLLSNKLRNSWTQACSVTFIILPGGGLPHKIACKTSEPALSVVSLERFGLYKIIISFPQMTKKEQPCSVVSKLALSDAIGCAVFWDRGRTNNVLKRVTTKQFPHMSAQVNGMFKNAILF